MRKSDDIRRLVVIFFAIVISGMCLSTSASASSIRSIDFNNFAYPGTEQLQNSHFSTGEFVLMNGSNIQWAIEGDVVVTYGDLTGDSQEEAIVNLVVPIPQSNAVEIFTYIFTTRNNSIQFLWGIATGAMNAYVHNGMLVLEVPKYESNDPICCPSKFSRRTFKWFTGTFMEFE